METLEEREVRGLFAYYFERISESSPECIQRVQTFKEPALSSADPLRRATSIPPSKTDTRDGNLLRATPRCVVSRSFSLFTQRRRPLQREKFLGAMANANAPDCGCDYDDCLPQGR